MPRSLELRYHAGARREPVLRCAALGSEAERPRLVPAPLAGVAMAAVDQRLLGMAHPVAEADVLKH